MRILLIVISCIVLSGCKEITPTCSIKKDHPMKGATYCEYNYARGYADAIEWIEKNPVEEK